MKILSAAIRTASRKKGLVVGVSLSCPGSRVVSACVPVSVQCLIFLFVKMLFVSTQKTHVLYEGLRENTMFRLQLQCFEKPLICIGHINGLTSGSHPIFFVISSQNF